MRENDKSILELKASVKSKRDSLVENRLFHQKQNVCLYLMVLIIILMF